MRRQAYAKLMVFTFGASFILAALYPIFRSQYYDYENHNIMIQKSHHHLNTRNQSPECLLKSAFQSREFVIFSHRSFLNSSTSQTKQQPSCEEAIHQLKNIGVHHLDLDLVLDTESKNANHHPSAPTLIVSHPMEFKRTSESYSPCSNLEFDELIHILRNVYNGDDHQDFFISLEPKASWGRTKKEHDDPALALPLNILQSLLDAVTRNHLRGSCAAIVNIDLVQGAEEQRLLGEILKICSLFNGIRISDQAPSTMGAYDIIMPSIEFHPRHEHNTGDIVPKELYSKSVFWTVDNEHDLRLAADMLPFGIVSNSPEDIVSIMNDPSWCSTDRVLV